MAEAVRTLACITHTRSMNSSNKLNSSNWAESSNMADRYYRPWKVKHVWWACARHCSCAVLVLINVSWYASFTTKRGTCIDCQNWQIWLIWRGQPVWPACWSGPTGCRSCSRSGSADRSPNRSDRSDQSAQNANWTSPLRRSRRDNRNAYVKHPMWSLDERVMADRSDRLGRS